MSDIKLPWAIKYRPTEFTDVILEPENKSIIKKYLDEKSIQHSIFEGKPGTGKTSVALMLKHNIIKDDDDFEFLNASDERGIDTIRSIIEYMRSPVMASPHKLIILDEADSMTADAWSSLRNPMENADINIDYSARFIFTVNNLSKIPDFIQSRCNVLHFEYPDKKYVIERLIYILNNENIQFEINDIAFLIDNYYPDIRAIINNAEKISINNILSVKLNIKKNDDLKILVISLINKLMDNKNQIVYTEESGSIVSDIKSSIIEEDFMSVMNEIRTLIHNNKYDLQYVVCSVLDDAGEKIPFHIYAIMNRYMNSFKTAFSETHHFCAMLYDIYNNLQ
jgi:DNA polymerase III delta prime subunit